jgi:3,4-dihydroxy 2-butanone 4-phosphate synthase/GTP cyclohydrolase II
MVANDSDDVANRRAQLRRWIRDRCDGKQAVFVEQTNINQGELSGLLMNKSFGEKRARNLEKAAKMPHKYLERRGHPDHPATDKEPTGAGEAPIQWPFARVTPQQYNRLSDSEKLAIEQIVALFVSRAGAATPSTRRLAHA